MAAQQTPWSDPPRIWSSERRRAPISGPTQVGVGGARPTRGGGSAVGDPGQAPEASAVFGPPVPYSPSDEAARREELYRPPAAETAPQHSQPEPPNRTGLLIGVGVVLLIIIGLLPMILHDNSTSTSSSPNVKASQATTASVKVAPAASAAKFVRGIAVGRVAANDGSTLTVEGVLGSVAVVRIDTRTRVLMLAAVRAADVKVGTMVIVQGDKTSDGTIKAKYIVGDGAPFSR
ncbi:hypothetical protein ACLMAL_29695 [Nocardia sp. CWNU-33]|uniref:hypothetical protein n=1 Tax=Nocardia sp. CWNU-33 TaxID=3392117 RepID=UPI00398EDB79